MTLHEIEVNLHDLQSRHPGLDEDMLVMLLRAGGWDEKDITDAKTLFRGRVSSSVVELAPEPVSQELLPDGIDPSRLLPEHTHELPMVIEEKKEEKPVAEPVSLVSSTKETGREHLPHNLPLRPFETSEHIWPFSRYRDVFYGEEEGKNVVVAKESPKEESVPPKPKEERSTSGVFKPGPVVLPEPKKVPLPPPVPAPPPSKTSHADEGLVIMACCMLLMVLLILGYMYSNGRL